MNVSVSNEDDRKLDFTLSKSSVSFANLLRRFSMSQVPTFAIDKVTVYENSSTLFDEYIAHRIGQVPLKISGSVQPDEEALFTLDATGPCTVYSGDFRTGHDKIRMALDKIPLLKLMQEQNLRLEGKAVSGVGRKHAKWQAGLAGYEILKDGGFNFKVEGFMQLPPRQMVLTAAGLIEEKCSQLSEQLALIKKESKESKKKKEE